MKKQTIKLISIGLSLIGLIAVLFLAARSPQEGGLFANGEFLEEGEMLGASITTIESTDTLRDSRAVINANFAALNADKLEDSDLTGGTGITYSSGDISFDCSEVVGTDIDCVGEAITLNPLISSFYTTPSEQITAGTNLTWSGNTLNASGGVGDVSAAASLTATSIVVGDDGIKGVKKSKVYIDASGNLLPESSDAQDIGSQSLTFSDAHFVTENGTYVTARQLAGLQRDYSEEAAILPYEVSYTVAGSQWTVTLTDVSGAGYLAFVLDDVTIRSPSGTLTVDASAFAGTDSLPKDVYLYVVDNGSNVPELTASNTSPEGLGFAHATTAQYKAGAVGISDITIYGKAENEVEMYQIAKNTFFRAYEDGVFYKTGMTTTAGSTDVTIGAGTFKFIFDTLSTVSRTISVDGQTFIKSDGTYNESTGLTYDGEYSDGNTIGNNKFFNVILGVLQNGTTRIHAVVQSGAEEYASLAAALADDYSQTSYYPSDSFLKNIFVPVARVIIKNTGGTYTIQEIVTGQYHIDIRSGVTGGGGGGSAPSSNIANGTADGQMTFWNDTTGQWVYTETNELFYDDTNKRLGIGNITPLVALDVTGSFAVSANSSLGTVTSGTWNGTVVDISDYTNLTVTAPITLTGDDIGITQTGITSLGTIGVGVWNGTAIDFSSYTNATVSSPITLTGDDIGLNQSAITGVGTIGTGVWQGTAITDAYISDTLTVDWTGLQNYPTGCTNQFVRTVGDTLTCATVDISSDTNLVAGSHLTLTDDTLSVDDDFLFNDGDIGTGVYDFGGATSFEIPNGTPTIDTLGEIGLNGDQLQYYGTAKRVITYLKSPSAIIESLAAADDDMPLGTVTYARTITKVGCRCIGTCTTAASITLEDSAGNAMTHTAPTCATTGAVTYQAVTAGGALTAGEGLAFDVDNTPAPETDTYEILFEYTVDAN